MNFIQIVVDVSVCQLSTLSHNVSLNSKFHNLVQYWLSCSATGFHQNEFLF